jgi:hypothetical protein
MPNPNFPNFPVNLLAVDGAIQPLGANNYFAVTKAGVAALTLAFGSVDGQRLIVQDVGGHAHVITVTLPSPVTAGLNGTHATATFNGTIGSFVELVSYAGSWYVLGSSGVTIGG